MSSLGTWSIRVVDDDGDGVAGAEVAYQCGHISGVGSDYTNDDGWVQFDVIGQTLGPGAIAVHKIWVDGEEVSDEIFFPEDGDTFSFVRPS